MDFLRDLHQGPNSLIQLAELARTWMDAYPKPFADRCLPPNIANPFGWKVLTPARFSTDRRDNGLTNDLVVRADANLPVAPAPGSLFLHRKRGIHNQRLLRTPPGWISRLAGRRSGPTT